MQSEVVAFLFCNKVFIDKKDMKYLKEFENHSQYEAYIASEDKILPNVSKCVQEDDVHYTPLTCEVETIYELIGTPSYPSEIDGCVPSFEMSFNYKKTDIDNRCRETVSEGSDTVVVEIGYNPSVTTSRTVESTYNYNGLEIEYSVTQTKLDAKITAKYNVTSTSYSTQIASNTSNFTAIEIDGIAQPSIESTYTFNTTGEHTVKYTLTDPTSIGHGTFQYCSNLTSIVMPDCVTSIGHGTFTYCSSLSSCTIGSGVTSIGNGSFSYCTSLTSIDIPSGVTSIGSQAFYGCSNLTSINIPSGATSISDSTFYNCTSLTSVGPTGSGASVEIPSGVTSIGNEAFYGCSSLTSIDIPSGVTSIGSSAFYGCRNLTSITVDTNNAEYSSEDGVLFNKAETTLIQYPVGNTRTSYNIPNSVTSISYSAFQYCGSLTSIDIPSGVTSIGDWTFQDCSGLTSITIPSGVTSIGDRAFMRCSSLTSIDIPSGVTSIGTSAFTFCSGLTSIDIPSGVTSIGNYTFDGCRSLTSINIPSGVTRIDIGAFDGCRSLTSCTIGSGVTSIGNYAFRNCSSITSIVSNATTAPTIQSNTFQSIKTGGTLTVPSGSSGYDVWMGASNYYLGKYNWTMVEQ